MRIARFTLTLIALLALTLTAAAQKDPLCKVWYNQEKDSKVEVYQVGNTFQAKIVWLKEPLDNGKPKVDKENPNEKLRNVPVMGLVFLRDLQKSKDTPNFYEGGKIYDPKNGKTYDCRMTFKGTTIELRGFVLGLPFLGRTSVWTLAEGQ